MTSMALFYIAILVFILMTTGLFLSVREFLQVSDDPSRLKSSEAVKAND